MPNFKISRLAVLPLLLFIVATPSARAQAHFSPGVANIRDYAVPAEEGLFFVDYNYGYLTS
jgi:hypothetical protein